MKVYVTQGHEKGIGLEVFFKTCLFLNQKELSQLTLIAFQSGVKETLVSLRMPFKLQVDSIQISHIHIPVIWLKQINVSQSFSALELGMKLAESGGVLYTLPTAKDQLNGHAGHTEYFRHFYNDDYLGMFFSSPGLQVLLVTDHVSIHNLPLVLTEEKIEKTIATALRTLKNWEWNYGKFLVAGINPHAGEGGMIGSEDTRVTSAIKRLMNKSDFEVSGPYPGDTILIERKSIDDVVVYMFHDQGLGVFKGLEGFIGSNITLGLPYPRFSPDHGTSFALFGKNQADYRGCRYSLNQALELLKRTSHGQNSGHKS